MPPSKLPFFLKSGVWRNDCANYCGWRGKQLVEGGQANEACHDTLDKDNFEPHVRNPQQPLNAYIIRS